MSGAVKKVRQSEGAGRERIEWKELTQDRNFASHEIEKEEREEGGEAEGKW